MEVLVLTVTSAELDGGDAILLAADTLTAPWQAGKAVVAVVSALAGVNDLLRDSMKQGNYANVYTKLLAGHSSAARRLIRDETARKVLLQDVADLLDSYNWLGKSLVNRTPTPAEADSIVTLGERLSARLLAANLQGRGVSAAMLTAAELVKGAPEAERPARIRAKILPLLEQRYLPLVTASPGFTSASVDMAALIKAAFPAD